MHFGAIKKQLKLIRVIKNYAMRAHLICSIVCMHQAADAIVYKLNQAIGFSSVFLYQASSKQQEKV